MMVKYNKAAWSPPTVIIDSKVLTRVTGTKTGRSMSTIDVEYTAIQHNNDKRILMLLHGMVTKLVARVIVISRFVHGSLKDRAYC